MTMPATASSTESLLLPPLSLSLEERLLELLPDVQRPGRR
jgi:hypothetical protein